jgi:ATP-dependent DNA helicase RecG
MTAVILKEQESKHIEFKSIIPKFDALIKTCIAFANASGGRIFIGVEDGSREVIGVSEEDRLKLYNDFANSLYHSVSPSLVAQIYEQNFGQHSVLIIEIPPSPRKPYFLKAKGVRGGTYIRVGSSTRLATTETIEDLTREAQRISYDEEIVHTDLACLSKDLLRHYFGATVSTKRLLSEKIIGMKPANKEDVCPTVAGILMFSETPSQYIKEALIRCTQFKGIEGRDILRTEDIVGTVEQQVSQGLKLLSAWMTKDYKLQGAKVEGVLPVPMEALREALINALLHRKYTIAGAIKVALYDDRLEIFSPGDFPGLVDINNLGDGTTFLRNPVLVRLAYQLKLIETRGTGIRLIYDSCRKAGIRKPMYYDDGDFVKVVFYFEPDVHAYDEESESIIAYVRLNKQVTAQQIADYLSVSRNTAIRRMVDLIHENKIKKVGKGPLVRYELP